MLVWFIQSCPSKNHVIDPSGVSTVGPHWTLAAPSHVVCTEPHILIARPRPYSTDASKQECESDDDAACRLDRKGQLDTLLQPRTRRNVH
jgi:hypothetical protein